MGTPEKSGQNRVQVTVTLPLSNKTFKVGIPADWTVEKFIAGVKKKMGKTDDAVMDAVLKRTGKGLNTSSTIKSEGIIDGDEIILRETVQGG
jgi:hypothetical protein